MRADARRNREQILAAAEAIFAEKGAAASTEEVAVRAGVAIGTVFRHFPTKRDLLAAIMKDLLERLSEEVDTLNETGDPATALFDFFARMVGEAAAKRSVVEALDLSLAEPTRTLELGVAGLLARAQAAGAVRTDVSVTEVMALLTATCQGALSGAWPPDLQRRTLAVIFAGLRPGPPDYAGSPRTARSPRRPEGGGL